MLSAAHYLFAKTALILSISAEIFYASTSKARTWLHLFRREHVISDITVKDLSSYRAYLLGSPLATFAYRQEDVAITSAVDITAHFSWSSVGSTHEMWSSSLANGRIELFKFARSNIL